MDRIRLVELPDFHDFDTAILGSFSLITGKGKRRVKYLKEDVCIDYKGTFETPSFHFRSIVDKIRFPKRNSFPYPSYAYHAIPQKLPYAYYLDVRKAYLQIASVWGAQCFISPQKIAGYGEYTFNDELFLTSKVARGLLVTGLAEKGKYTIWEDQALAMKGFYNSSHAPHLRGAIALTLHSLFADLKRYIVYAHTDGMIVPEWYLSKVENILTEWGLNHTIKAEGYTHVRGVGSYLIGSKSTVNYHRRQSNTIRSNIWTEDATWFKRMYIRGVERRNRNNSLLDVD